jgi:hypothetical protein
MNRRMPIGTSGGVGAGGGNSPGDPIKTRSGETVWKDQALRLGTPA